MVFSLEEVVELIEGGACISVSAEGLDYPVDALIRLAEVAAKNKHMLTIRGAEDTGFADLKRIAEIGKGFVTFDL